MGVTERNLIQLDRRSLQGWQAKDQSPTETRRAELIGEHN